MKNHLILAGYILAGATLLGVACKKSRADQETSVVPVKSSSVNTLVQVKPKRYFLLV